METQICNRKSAALDITWVREQFPSLKLKVNGRPAAFLDGPGGTQVPQRVMDAVTNYFLQSNANVGGAYLTSERNDAMLAEAHRAMADLLGCEADEVSFGQNMTTLTLLLSRAIGRELGPGDEILLTWLDHDGNVSPWLALEEKGVIIRRAEVNPADCTLRMDDLAAKITPKTRVVAAGYASNAVGTINPVKEIVHLAHAAGALAIIDAVHYAPHGSIDVRDLDCDFLLCSPYKFFAPHSGVVYGKRAVSSRLRPYKVRAQYDRLPEQWETGTLSHENIAGVLAAVEYLADLGRHCEAAGANRRAALLAAYAAVRNYERGLMQPLISGLLRIPGLKVYGIADPARFGERTPTVAVRVDGHTPIDLARKLGERGIFTWDGHYFALDLARRLDVEATGGWLRIGLVHYNTAEEVARVVEELKRISAGK
ncbi:MAG TPA: cysteine desulfurase-like protein [Terriglobales bacterium]|nr:cysteine desulfurase-like protein [Terriglobales bacterium]